MLHIYVIFLLLAYFLDLLYLIQALFSALRCISEKSEMFLTFPLKKSASTILINVLKKKTSQHEKPLTF